MSGEHQRAETPQGPPWPLDLLADLHAGLLDRCTADELLPRAREDPDARETLAALDATSADLAGLPALTIPDDVTARVDTALQNEVLARSQNPAGETPAPPPAPDRPADQPTPVGVIDFEKARRRRRAWGAGIMAAVAAVAGVVVLASTQLGSGSNQLATGPIASTTPSALALHGEDATLNPRQFSEIRRSQEYGALSDPEKLIGCLRANGITGGKPIGAQKVTLDGRPAELLILPSGKIGQFRVLAVGEQCGPGNPATLSTSTFGG